ncbi:TPA: hypothetical protein ACSQIM_002253 [Clostridium perfringens]|uniref:hypothetical protein n=1 Tax=Clostridium perfringens TaxID=1502 RepID=UPI000BBFDBFD|nr:hypothetical protein [Clostridium perfringens]ASY50131.1 hypothetical protein BG908_00135 [Clostridium perfringens]AWS24610.1 hypothetical protein CYK96_02955 [Clostridium perfringens]MDB2038791.1 hypothetical protein [Clostridium perfringens]MDB2047604.1 hypothetical protein [Clostridium perfringens]MDK0669252.1 hypothetical protein [Clostridium perfringens]
MENFELIQEKLKEIKKNDREVKDVKELINVLANNKLSVRNQLVIFEDIFNLIDIWYGLDISIVKINEIVSLLIKEVLKVNK